MRSLRGLHGFVDWARIASLMEAGVPSAQETVTAFLAENPMRRASSVRLEVTGSSGDSKNVVFRMWLIPEAHPRMKTTLDVEGGARLAVIPVVDRDQVTPMASAFLEAFSELKGAEITVNRGVDYSPQDQSCLNFRIRVPASEFFRYQARK